LDTTLAALAEALREEISPEERAGMFYQQGCLYEKRQDYVAAVEAYQAGATLPAGEQWRAYFLRNNLAFCLNFMRRFAEAERWCRDAIALEPALYNAWKNLGVSLEHQGRPLESALCYVCAISQSGGQEVRSRMHLRRLVQRFPSTGTLVVVKQCLPTEQYN
jgi:tetratricopeptide (TPR) repeat protein